MTDTPAFQWVFPVSIDIEGNVKYNSLIETDPKAIKKNQLPVAEKINLNDIPLALF